MSTYSVTIQMSSATVNALLSSGFNLYGLQAVKSTFSGAPTVWYRTGSYSLNTVLTWNDQYQAYTSHSQIVPQGQIIPSFAAPISPGQTLNVTTNGIGTVTESGNPGVIEIVNQTSTQFTCGISEEQPDGGGFAPICAFSLFGNGMDAITPAQQVFLMFSTVPVNTGTVLEQSFGQGILIDLSSSASQTVSYDVNSGWSWGGGSWATAYPPNINLQPLLIQQG